MKTVEQHIKTLLYEQDCVIIPNFGGLLARRMEAAFNEKLQKYIPVRKGIAFNEALKMDDGLLVYTIAMREEISRLEAAQLVQQFVEKLKHRLALQRIAYLEGIGKFSVNEENKYVFEPETSLNFESYWFGLPEVTLRPLFGSKKVVTLVDEQVNVQEEEIDTVPFEPVVKTATAWRRWAAAAMIAGISALVGFMSQDAATKIVEQANLLSWFAPTEQSAAKQAPMAIHTQQSSIVPDVFRETTLPVVEQEVVEEATTTEQADEYELIVGSFTTMNAAEKLRAELVEKGYDKAYILDKKSSRFYKVVAASTDDLQEAQTLRTALAKNVGDGVWILEHTK